MFGILGCVEVMGPQGRTPPLSGRHRALIAALALQPGVVVPYWRLTEALWGEQPPRTAVRSLHSHVARLRLLLESAGLGGVLQTRDPGYLLAVESLAVDAGCFESELRKAREGFAAGAVDAAAERLDRALSLWRGAALADAEPTGWTAAEAVRLENLRSAAMADRCEAMLALGRYGEALAETERLLAENPLRERLVGLHMIALWGCGRSAEAFASYQRLREGLADELGVDPSPDLAQTHTAMLRGAEVSELRPPGSIITLAPRQTSVSKETGALGQTSSIRDGSGSKQANGSRADWSKEKSGFKGVPHERGLPAVAGRSGSRFDERRPAQLPPPVGYFTGRAQDLDALDEVARRPGVVGLICGHGGIGKTSLAVQWAHQRGGDFPDGQVFVDARGHDRDTALSAGELAGVLLRCLGVPADRVPDGLDERIGLYRSLLAGKRMLIIIDNAGGTDQVGPVVPSVATSFLLVTSRGDLAALVTHVEVHRIVLGMLTESESTDLFRKVLGPQRVDAEPQAISRLANLCGRMPLALRIAAAKLVTHPSRPIGALADEVSGDDRLAHLGVEDGTRTVEAVFTTAYQALSPNAQTLLRRLGQHPGPHFCAALAKAMCPDTDALDELVAAHLVSPHTNGRYRFHDLVRLFAQGCAGGPERAEVTDRILDWYLATASAANRTLDPSRDRIRPTLRCSVEPAGKEELLDLLDAERDNLRAMVAHAAGNGREQAACQLTYLLSGFYVARGHWAERIDMCEQAVQAARRLGDPVLEAEMHRALGVAYRAAYRLTDALESHLRALPLLTRAGDESGLAHLYNNIGGANVELRRFEEAVVAYRMAIKLHTESGNVFGAVTAERNLGFVYVRMGETELSIAHLDSALAASREIGYQRLEAGTLDSLGEAHLRGGHHERARECFRDALRVSRAIGERRYEMDALLNLGLTHLRDEDSFAAMEFFGQALELSRALRHRHAEARILAFMAEAHLLNRDYHAAESCLESSRLLRDSVPDPFEQARLHQSLGDLARAIGRHEAAADHWELAAGLYHKANAPAEAEAVIARGWSGVAG